LVKEQFGTRLRTARMNLDLTQKEFADVVEISQGMISQYEMGKFIPPMRTMVKIAKNANISLDWLCGLSEESIINDIDRKYTVYKVFYGKEVVYVGRTYQPLDRRLPSHFINTPMVMQLNKQDVTKIEYAELKTEADMYLYDVYYINKYKPRLNTDNKSKQPLSFELPELDFIEIDREFLASL